MVAQYGELKRQVPLLYVLLILNACGVTYSQFDFAPAWATVGFLGLLIATCGWRIVCWTKAPEAHRVSFADARIQLVRTTVLAGALGVVFLVWSLMMSRYGGPAEQGHVALFIGVTVIGCIFCLACLPSAAMLVTAVVTLPYSVFYVLRGDPVFAGMALNIALVTGVMVRVLLNGFAGFTSTIRSRAELLAKQEETQRLSRENARLAHTDALTGLPNRRHFFGSFEERLQIAAREQRQLAIGVLDLDRFKAVNDTYGHAFGDRLLVEVALRLSAFIRNEVICARLGGDEFGVLFTGDLSDVQGHGQAICDALASPFEIDERTVSIGCSAGVAVFPEAGHTVQALYDRADAAAYHMKTTRRGGCVLSSIEHEKHIRSERALETALLTANLNQELHVCYQPIVCLKTGEVRSVEALGRWSSPTIGRVPPDRFIVAAEKLDIINLVTLELFNKALADFCSMPAALRLSFNLSAKDIICDRTLARLTEAIGSSGIDPRRITFELTETALMHDFNAAISGIQILRALGIRFALDDFGVGYSSLGHLRRLPFDEIKLDRTFMESIDEGSGRNILSGILALCRMLELDCVAEGVEGETQLRSLILLGCQRAQGYHFARPMLADDLQTFLATPLPERQHLAPVTRVA